MVILANLPRVRTRTAPLSCCAPVTGRLRPRRAGIIRSVEAAVLRVDDRVDAAATGGRHRNPDASDAFGRQTIGQRLPVGAAVSRLVEPAARAVRRRIHAPRRTP